MFAIFEPPCRPTYRYLPAENKRMLSVQSPLSSVLEKGTL